MVDGKAHASVWWHARRAAVAVAFAGVATLGWLADAAASNNLHWSGFVSNSTSQVYNLVEANWYVPTVQYVTGGSYGSSPGQETTAIWIGIGGDNGNPNTDNTLIQIGVSGAVVSNGSTVYQAWYELVGQVAQTFLTNCTAGFNGPPVSCTVVPGDQIAAVVQCLQVSGNQCNTPNYNNEWLLQLQDITQGWFWSSDYLTQNGVPQPIYYQSSLASVEWIVEAPYFSNVIAPLAGYCTGSSCTVPGSLEFWGVTANGSLNLSIAANGLSTQDPNGGYSTPCRVTTYSGYPLLLVEYNSYGNFCSHPPIKLVDTHDFNGDGYSDILWYDISGDAAMWLMNGPSILQSAGVGTVPKVWSIAGQRDFNADGKADILWHDTAGDVAVWLMNGATISQSLGVGNVNPSVWSIVGTGDFFGNGNGDILWRDTSGDVAIWELSGNTIVQSCGVGTAPTNWSIVGTGDFNGDGMTDILWHDTSGDVAIWEMNGCSILQSAGVGTANPSVWSIAGTGDFSGSGRSAILWRDTSGDVAIWFMNGATITQSSGVGTANPSIWSIAQTGDYYSTGMSDILWRDTSGDVAVWQMNGATITQSTGIGTAPPVWSIQGAGAD